MGTSVALCETMVRLKETEAISLITSVLHVDENKTRRSEENGSLSELFNIASDFKVSQ